MRTRGKKERQKATCGDENMGTRGERVAVDGARSHELTVYHVHSNLRRADLQLRKTGGAILTLDRIAHTADKQRLKYRFLPSPFVLFLHSISEKKNKTI
jgi:hypothetical protein